MLYSANELDLYRIPYHKDIAHNIAWSRTQPEFWNSLDLRRKEDNCPELIFLNGSHNTELPKGIERFEQYQAQERHRRLDKSTKGFESIREVRVVQRRITTAGISRECIEHDAYG